MKVAIIKYNAGNVRSVELALERVGVSPAVTSDPEVLSSADKIIFPGVGEASSAMRFLKEQKLDLLIPQLKQPVLGICLGMQLMCSHSEEGDTECLNIMDVKVKKFVSSQLKVPQIGWNIINELKGPLFNGIKENEYVYFVHGYYAENSELKISSSNYILEYSSALQKDNFYAVQFHPEKSAAAGQKVLSNFLNL